MWRHRTAPPSWHHAGAILCARHWTQRMRRIRRPRGLFAARPGGDYGTRTVFAPAFLVWMGDPRATVAQAATGTTRLAKRTPRLRLEVTIDVMFPAGRVPAAHDRITATQGESCVEAHSDPPLLGAPQAAGRGLRTRCGALGPGGTHSKQGRGVWERTGWRSVAPRPKSASSARYSHVPADRRPMRAGSPWPCAPSHGPVPGPRRSSPGHWPGHWPHRRHCRSWRR